MTAWPTASSITYGQTLASSTLTGGASIPAGSFAFTTPTTAPGAGTASQSVTFTPTDTTDYSTVTGTVKRDGEQGNFNRDDVADGQFHHLRPDSGFLDAVGRRLDSGWLVRLHHAGNRSGRRHSLAKRDLHAHRHDRLQHADWHGERDGQQGDSNGDDMADGQFDHLRPDAGILDAVGRSLDSGGLVRLYHDDNRARCGHGIAERNLHAHRYDRLQHVDRHGKRNGEQGDVHRDDMADGQFDHLRPDAGILDAVGRSLDSGGLVRLYHADNSARCGHGIAERNLHAHRCNRLQHVDRHGQA